MKNTKENTYILYFEEGLCLQDHHEHIYDIDPKLGAERTLTKLFLELLIDNAGVDAKDIEPIRTELAQAHKEDWWNDIDLEGTLSDRTGNKVEYTFCSEEATISVQDLYNTCMYLRIVRNTNDTAVSDDTDDSNSDKYGAESLGQQLLKSGAKVKKLYASIAFYSGESNIKQIIFGSKEDAAIDCKANYKRAVKEGLESGDIDSHSWNDETVSGSINWEDGNQSIFEVQESNFFSSAVCNKFLCKEYDKERIQEEKIEKDGYFEIALIEKPGCEGLTRTEVMDLHDMLSRPEAFPIEIGDINGNSSAIGFITPQAAEELQYEYGQDSELGQFISAILDDMTKESEDGTYVFKDLRVWMSRNIDN